MPAIAAGPDRLLLATNDTVALFHKDGRFIDKADATGFFASVNTHGPGFGQGSSYQKALFDPGSERFFFLASGRMTGPNEEGNYRVGFRNGAPCELGECIADVFLGVSKDAHPETLTPDDWHLYALDWTLDNDTRTRNFSPHAMLSMNDEAIVIASGAINYPTEEDINYEPSPEAPAPPSRVNYGKVRVIDKSRVLNGEPVDDWVDFTDPLTLDRTSSVQPRFGAVVPARTDDRLFVVSVHPHTCDIDLWAIEGAPSAPEFNSIRVEMGDACRTSAGRPAPQLDGPPLNTAGISDLAFLSAPVMSGDSIWGVRPVLSTSEPPRAAIHWFQIDISAWPLAFAVQSDIFEIPDSWLHLPALTVDPAGNMAMIFREARHDIRPRLMVTGRLAGDPRGSLREPKVLREADAVYDFDRSGYYSDAALDPADQSMWLFGQFAHAEPQWSTWVGQVWPMGFE